MKKSVLALLAVAGLAAVANAQGIDGQAGFSFAVPPGLPSGTTPDADGVVDITGLGNTFTLQLLVGGFGGQGNLGLLSWVGGLNLAGTGASITANALRAPYNFGGIVGVMSPDGQSISGIDANRSAFQDNIPWLFGDPQPAPALLAGIDAMDDVYRVTVTLSDTTTARDITLSATGISTFVTGWGVTAISPPTEEDAGSVSYAVNAIATDLAPGAIILRIVPAPGAAALLGLGGLLAARRRRA
ncbi:MAG: hypothetical protein H7Y88_13510 [Phycisphaerales bacterium]|nr:hypothetical protein [Phycisphaerales bacterium]